MEKTVKKLLDTLLQESLEHFLKELLDMILKEYLYKFLESREEFMKNN